MNSDLYTVPVKLKRSGVQTFLLRLSLQLQLVLQTINEEVR